jgi:predicted HAD superfamily phosphohydrolase YqeG
MFVIRNDNTVFCDIDSTLIAWHKEEVDPNNTRMVEVKFNNEMHHHWVLNENVEQLYKHHSRMQPIILWSQGGSEWAEAVAKALDLDKIVTAVMSKPKFVIDDLPASAWMPNSRLAEKKK